MAMHVCHRNIDQLLWNILSHMYVLLPALLPMFVARKDINVVIGGPKLAGAPLIVYSDLILGSSRVLECLYYYEATLALDLASKCHIMSTVTLTSAHLCHQVRAYSAYVLGPIPGRSNFLAKSDDHRRIQVHSEPLHTDN